MNNQIIIDNKGLIVSIAKGYMGKGLDFDDLMQEGYIGLMAAHTKYKPNMGIKFSSYAYYFIRRSIRRAVESTGSLIRVPSYANMLRSPDYTDCNDNTITNIDNVLENNHIINKIREIINDDTECNMYLDYFMHGLSLRDLGNKYNMSHQGIANKLKVLHTIVKEKLTE